MAAEMAPVEEIERGPLPRCSAPNCPDKARAEFYCNRCNIVGYCSKKCRKYNIADHTCISHCYYRDRKVHTEMTKTECDCYSTFNFYAPGLEEVLKTDFLEIIDNFGDIDNDVWPVLVLDQQAEIDMYEYHGVASAQDVMSMDYDNHFLAFVMKVVEQIFSSEKRYIVWFIKAVDRVFVRKLDFVNIVFDKDVPFDEARILYKLCRAKFASMSDDERTQACGKINSRAQLDLNAKLTRFVVSIEKVEIEEFADINRRITNDEAEGIECEIVDFEKIVGTGYCEMGALYTFCPDDLSVMAAVVYAIQTDRKGAKFMTVKLMKRRNTYFLLIGVETLIMSIKQRALEHGCVVIIAHAAEMEMIYVWHVFGFCLTTRPIITGAHVVHKICAAVHPETRMRAIVSMYRAGRPCGELLAKLAKNKLVRYRKKHGFDFYYPIEEPQK